MYWLQWSMEKVDECECCWEETKGQEKVEGMGGRGEQCLRWAEKRLSSSGTGLTSDKRRDASSICLGWKEKMMGNLIGR